MADKKTLTVQMKRTPGGVYVAEIGENLDGEGPTITRRTVEGLREAVKKAVAQIAFAAGAKIEIEERMDDSMTTPEAKLAKAEARMEEIGKKIYRLSQKASQSAKELKASEGKLAMKTLAKELKDLAEEL